jgi:hypothetical protein
MTTSPLVRSNPPPTCPYSFPFPDVTLAVATQAPRKGRQREEEADRKTHNSCMNLKKLEDNYFPRDDRIFLQASPQFTKYISHCLLYLLRFCKKKKNLCLTIFYKISTGLLYEMAVAFHQIFSKDHRMCGNSPIYIMF